MNIRIIALMIGAVAGVPVVLILYSFIIEKLVEKLNPGLQKKLRPWFWIIPAFSLLAVFLIYPVINTVILSFKNADSTEFIGIKNYLYVFTNSTMLIALRNNLLWLVIFTLFTVTLGLFIAVLTDRVKYESVAKAFVFMPMAISFVAAGVIWKFMYEYRPKGAPQIGTLNAILTMTLPGFEPKAWLFDPAINNFALIAVGIWIWTGFCMVILSAGLKGIPDSVIEAAKIDGAGEWRIFWRITIPLMKSTITVVATTMVINVLKIFDIVYVMTNGNLNTEVIANRMYKEMFSFRDFGRASAIATVLLIAITPMMLINIKRFGQRR